MHMLWHHYIAVHAKSVLLSKALQRGFEGVAGLWSSEASHLGLHPPALLQPETRNHRFFVNVDPAAAGMDNFHGAPPTARPAGECYSVRVYLACSSSLIG